MFMSISEKMEASQAGDGKGGLGSREELGCPGHCYSIVTCQTCSQIIKTGTELFPQIEDMPKGCTWK